MRALRMVASGAAGAAAGLVMMALLDPAQRSTDLDIWVISMSAFIGIGLCHLLTRPD